MNLDTFISETIKSMIKGVKDSQQYARDNGGRINPIRVQGYVKTDYESVYFGKEEKARPLTNIEFDIAVTTSSQDESELGGSIKVLSIGVGGKGASTNSNETISRIKFTIGIALPHELT